MAESKRQKREGQDISCAAGSIFNHPTQDEAPPALVEEPVEEKEAPPALVEEPSEEEAEAPPALLEETSEVYAEGEALLPEGHTHEGIDRDHAEYGRYISNMVSRWAGSDYESSPDEYAHCSSGCSRGH
jgi:hypothetical protein